MSLLIHLEQIETATRVDDLLIRRRHGRKGPARLPICRPVSTSSEELECSH